MSKRKPLKLGYILVDDLSPYVQNSRTHSPEQIKQVAASIKEFGFTNPILIDEDGTIIAGHGRLAAAKSLGMAEVPTVTLAGLTVAQKKAYVIADNSLALNAGWDVELLRLELDALEDLDFDIDLLGLDDDLLGIESDVEAYKDIVDDGEEFNLVITCVTETEQTELYSEFMERELEVKIMQ